VESVSLYFKTTVGLIGSIVSYMVDGLGLAFVVLLGLMLADFITGIMAASANEGLSSAVGRKGFIRKLYVIILIGSVYLIEKVVLQSHGYLGDGVTIAYCVIEFISVTENGGKLGVPMPAQVKNVLAALKNREVEKK
jgi:toxin secretion/phage lysis holin